MASKKTTKKVVKKKTTTPKVEPAKMHHKVLTIIMSVGPEDRDRDLEEYFQACRDAIITTGSRNIVRTGGYYILDGKVCLEGDYDPDIQNFKEGAGPPPWAGGAMGNAAVERSTGGEQKGAQPVETKPRTPAEAMRDLHENTEWGRKNEQRIKEEKRARELAKISDDDLEWDEDDATDDKKLGKAADKSSKRAIAKLKKTTPSAKKKIVVKKKTGDVTPPPAKKVVRRKK